jgi:hypothetical protein
VRRLLIPLLVASLAVPGAAFAQQATTGTSQSTTPAAQTTPALPDPVVTKEPVRHDDTPAIVLLVVVIAMVLAATAFWSALRLLALEPGWYLRGRHSFAEAGWRMSATWAEFTDWLRLGR